MPHVGDVGEGRGRMIKALRKTVGAVVKVAMVYIRDKNITEQWKTIKNSMYVEVRIHNI